MKRRLGVVLLMLGIGVAALPSLATHAHATVLQPLTITKTTIEVNHTPQDGNIWYEITVHNPNPENAVSLDCVTDTLPPGFSYVGGSTSGSPSPGEPDSQDCPPFGWFYDGTSIDGGQSFTIQFEAHVDRQEPLGVYCNEASAQWDDTSADTGPTAPVQVTEFVADSVSSQAELSCVTATATATSTPVQIVHQATPTFTATPRATATSVPPTVAPTKTPAPQSTVLAAQATPKPAQPAALPSTGSGSGSGHGASTWMLTIAGALIASGVGLTLAGRKRA